MPKLSRCDHVPPKSSEPNITLRVSGGSEGIRLCPDCYVTLAAGGEVILTSGSRRQRHRYTVIRAAESTESLFFEVRKSR